MRQIRNLIIHTTASPQAWGWERLSHFFLRDKGWKREGYHVVIEPSGRVVRRIANEGVSNGIKAYADPNGLVFSNRNSVNVSWIGGILNGDPKKWVDNRTEAQKAALLAVVQWYVREYPSILILGHNQVAAKACPCFSVPNWLAANGIPKANIYPRDNLGIIKSLRMR